MKGNRRRIYDCWFNFNNIKTQNNFFYKKEDSSHIIIEVALKVRG